MRRHRNMIGCCLCLMACGSNKAEPEDGKDRYFFDAGGEPASGDRDGGRTNQREGGRTDDDSAMDLPEGGDDGPTFADPVERGAYLVHHVAACVECHTPRDAVGRLDESRSLSGVECLRDSAPDDDETGCLNSGNLTHHETGLKNRSDDEIKAMFMEGVRPNGKALHPAMPYWVFGNMSDNDADAIVAYLRTVKPIDHMAPPNQPPHDSVAAPTKRWPKASLPSPGSDYRDKDAAMRGRYLAASVGSCIECHTPRKSDGTSDFSRAFRGGLHFDRDELQLPSAFFPAVISSANLTPHEDGLAGWTVKDVVTALKDGRDRDGNALCPPMAGGMGAFGGLTTADAEDIGHYLLSLTPGEGKVVDECTAPF